MPRELLQLVSGCALILTAVFCLEPARASIISGGPASTDVGDTARDGFITRRARIGAHRPTGDIEFNDRSRANRRILSSLSDYALDDYNAAGTLVASLSGNRSLPFNGTNKRITLNQGSSVLMTVRGEVPAVTEGRSNRLSLTANTMTNTRVTCIAGPGACPEVEIPVRVFNSAGYEFHSRATGHQAYTLSMLAHIYMLDPATWQPGNPSTADGPVINRAETLISRNGFDDPFDLHRFARSTVVQNVLEDQSFWTVSKASLVFDSLGTDNLNFSATALSSFQFTIDPEFEYATLFRIEEVDGRGRPVGVPEPGAIALLLMGLGLIGARNQVKRFGHKNPRSPATIPS